jgi:hypothetical protein
MPDIPAPTFASMPTSSPILAMPPPVVHTIPRVDDTIYLSRLRARMLMKRWMQ